MADSKGKDDKAPAAANPDGGDPEIKGLFDGEAPATALPSDPLNNLFQGAKAAPAPAARTEQSTLAVLGNWEGSGGGAPNLKSTQMGVAPDAAGQVAGDIAKAKAQSASKQALGMAKTQMGVAPETAKQVEDALAAVMGEKAAATAAKPAADMSLAKTQLGVAPGAAFEKLDLPGVPTESELADMPIRESFDLQELHSVPAPEPPSTPAASSEGFGDLPELPDLSGIEGGDGAAATPRVDSLLDLSPAPATVEDAPDASEKTGGKRGLLIALVGVVVIAGAVVVGGGLLPGEAPDAAPKQAPAANPPAPKAAAAAPPPAAPAAPEAKEGAAVADEDPVDPEAGLDPSAAADPAPSALLGGDDKAAAAAAKKAAKEAVAAQKQAAADAKKAAREVAAAEKQAEADAQKAAREAKRAAANAAREAAAAQKQAAADAKKAAREAKRAAANTAKQAAAERAAAQKAAAPKSARELIVHAAAVVKEDPARAESMLREGLTAEPGNHRLQEALAAALLAQGRGKEAVVLTAQIIKRRPKRASYRVIHGDALKASGDEAGAKAQWEQALVIDADNQRALRRLGR